MTRHPGRPHRAERARQGHRGHGSPRRHRPGCRSPGPRRGRSRPAAARCPARGPRAARRSGRAPRRRRRGHAHHADGRPSRTASSEADDGCRTASANAAEGAPNTWPWTAAQSRGVPRGEPPRRSCAPGPGVGTGTVAGRSSHTAVLADTTAKPRRSSWARRTSPPRWSQTLNVHGSVAGRHHRQAGVQLALAVGTPEAPGVVAQHAVGPRGGRRAQAPGPGRCSGRRRRGGGGAAATGPWSAPHRVGCSRSCRVAWGQRAPAWRARLGTAPGACDPPKD